jgi:DNA helicase-2/ATP-dependent DNA helicase PcrA
MNESAFTQAFENLNEAQQKAVETIYGPVMVIAGPGTGKTQIIALRTANILLKTDVNPENILITTFTEAGVISIKRRLMELVGTVGSRVNVSTIHAFCNDVIQAYPERFLAYKASRSIDDIEQIEIYEQIFTANQFEFLSSDYDPLFYLQNARDRVGKLKQE